MVWGSSNLKSCETILKKVENNDPNLKDLVILPIKTFGDTEIYRLSHAFRKGQNTNLQSIHASGHEVTPAALSTLATSLMSSRVHSISIGHSNMGDDAVVAFCSPLEVYNGGIIQNIDFELKNVGPRGMEAIGRAFRSSSLLELRLGRNPLIGDDGCLSFASAFKDCSGRDTFPSLQYLDISACNIGESGLQAITNVISGRISNNQLDLRLDSNPLGPSACYSLSSLIDRSCLFSLSVKDCSIGDEGIGILCSSIRLPSFSGLTSIILSDNSIGPDGSKYLADLIASDTPTMTIKELNLSRNPLGPLGVGFICKALEKRRQIDTMFILQSLDLNSTNCGTEGARLALTCNAVYSLNLFNNCLGSGLLTSLAPTLTGGHRTLESLDIGGNSADAQAIWEVLNSVTKKDDSFESRLRTIMLGGNSTNDTVQALVNELAIIRPELDIAIDRPNTDESDDNL